MCSIGIHDYTYEVSSKQQVEKEATSQHCTFPSPLQRIFNVRRLPYFSYLCIEFVKKKKTA